MCCAYNGGSQKIIKAEAKLGLSTRGTGHVKKEDGVDYVADDFQLLGVDIVSTPSVSSAQLLTVGCLSLE